MVEALRDYHPGKCGNGADCFAEIENLGRYKNVSATRALNPHFKGMILIFGKHYRCVCNEGIVFI